MKTNKPLRTAVVGCGFIGGKRARWINEDPRTVLCAVADSDGAKAQVAATVHSARAETDWKKLVNDPSIDILVVSTPNHLLCPVACAALSNGKHVLIEKPMGRNAVEAKKMLAASKKANRVLKVGFNHRYHPGLQKAHELFTSGKIGRILNMRAAYGHGGRIGYEKEWRGKASIAGGGELTDQGVHLIDLMQWFCGRPVQVSGHLQTAFWKIRPSEDNGFAVLRFPKGVLGSFHSSWTQWKNLFRFEIFGDKGFIVIDGLGGSYGMETLTLGTREKPGQVPEIHREFFEGEDLSWKLEWDDFINSILNGKRCMGSPREGLDVMEVLNALYKSDRSGKTIRLN